MDDAAKAAKCADAFAPFGRAAAELRRRIAERDERDRAEYEAERATAAGPEEQLGYEGEG